MMTYKVAILILAVGCIICCISCSEKKISPKKITGKWVWEIYLPKEVTGLKDINEATIEFFEDKTFKMQNVPAVTVGDKPIGGRPAIFDGGGKGKVFAGSGIWKMCKSSGSDAVELHFTEINGINRKYCWVIHIYRFPGGKISLYYEYDSYLCLFNKVKVD